MQWHREGTLFMFRQCARLCMHVPCLMGDGNLLGTILISIINHEGCHFQIPFPLPNLLNVILYHTTNSAWEMEVIMRGGLLIHALLYRGNVSLASSRGISHFLSLFMQGDLYLLNPQQLAAHCIPVALWLYLCLAPQHALQLLEALSQAPCLICLLVLSWLGYIC